MKSKKYLILLFFISLVWLLMACAPTSVQQAQLLSEVSPDERLLVSEGFTTAVYHKTEGSPLFVYPKGRLSADGTTHVSTQSTRSGTVVNVFDATTGKLHEPVEFEGNWHLRVVSPNGRFYVMDWKDEDPDHFQTHIQVVDLLSGRVIEEMHLDGNFEVEAIDNEGTAVFLINHLPAINPQKYQVRFYDLEASRLDENVLRDKRVIEEFMTGYAWGTVTSTNGEWLMTLYMNTKRNQAFVHALNLNNRWTLCLNLPSLNSDFETLQQYTIAISPDNRMLYAANPALGRVVGINLESVETEHIAIFEAATTSTGESMRVSQVSDDGRFFYFTADNLLWTYNTKTGTVTQSYEADHSIIGLEYEAGIVYLALEEAELVGLSAVSLDGETKASAH